MHPHLTFQVLDAFMDQQHIASAKFMSSFTDNIEDDSDHAAWNGLFQ